MGALRGQYEDLGRPVRRETARDGISTFRWLNHGCPFETRFDEGASENVCEAVDGFQEGSRFKL